MHSTNDPTRESFVDVAPDSHFPIQNLPYGLAQPRDGGDAFLCSAIGDYVVNLATLEDEGFFDGDELDNKQVFQESTLNAFMGLGRQAWTEARTYLSTLLSDEESTLRDNESLKDRVLIPMDEVEMQLPVDIGDYTDFYSSEQHATNVGSMFRDPENALKPNWKICRWDITAVPVRWWSAVQNCIVPRDKFCHPTATIRPFLVPANFAILS